MKPLRLVVAGATAFYQALNCSFSSSSFSELPPLQRVSQYNGQWVTDVSVITLEKGEK